MHDKALPDTRQRALSSAIRLGLIAMIASTPVWQQALADTQVSQPTAQQSVSRDYQLPPGPLGLVLSQFASQAGVALSFDAASLAGNQSPGLQGRYSVEQGFATLLGGSGFQAVRRDGGYILQAVAQGATNLQLSPITIQGQHSQNTDNSWVYQAPRSVSVISREQIERHPPRHAADMLETSAGVYTAVNQQDPGLSVNIRGIQDYGRVNMNIDGMRQNYQQSGHQQRNGTLYIDPELLSSVVISKGASSGMGGAGVIGGMAEFRTLSAADLLQEGREIGGRLRATTGIGNLSNGTHFIGSGALALGNDRWDLLLAASERNLGNYEPGSRGAIGKIRTQAGTANDATKRLKNSTVDYSANEMRSFLLKTGLNLTPSQRLQLSYLNTEVSYEDANLMSVTNSKLWEKLGDSDISSHNIALDYHYDPANPLINLQGKVYFVENRNQQNNLARGSSAAYRIEFRTRTLGLQLENTSTFNLSERSVVDFNYGAELFQDRVRPDSNQPATSPAVSFPFAEGMTPKGDRTMASLFSKLSLEHDGWLNAAVGLRYDRYQLQGKTGMTIRRFSPPMTFTQEALTFDVDHDAGQLSPTFELAVKPGLEWLQLFASYGKGWRPPAVTETLMYGRPHGGGGEWMYPSPYLKPERSSAWELGFNVLKQGLLQADDQLGIKVAYFDTRIDNFTYMAINRQVPGFGTGPTLGTVAHVNDLTSTRFRGVEYQASYDTGRLYADFTYTHMIGKNQYCSKNAWLGGAERYGFVPNQGIISIPDDYANSNVSCGGLMGSSEHMPMDRGSLVLGARLLDQKLNVGTRIRYSEGYTESYAGRNLEAIYPADWASYTAYDFFAGYQATAQTKLSLALENAFDRAYLVPLGDVYAFTLSRGRTLTASAEYQF